MRTSRKNQGRGPRPLPAAGILVALGIIMVTGCDYDDLLDVDDPETATVEDIQDPQNLPAVRAHAIGEFQVAYAGRGAAQDNSFILMSGLLADEYEASGTFPTRVEVDRRNIRVENATTQTTFRLMHRARAAANRSIQAHELNDPGTQPHAEAHVLEGFMYNAFGEMYCSGVPFSELPPGEDPIYGDPLTTEQMFQAAVTAFNQGATIAETLDDATREAHAAAIGTARALLNQGLYDEAAAAVAEVPTDFVFEINHSDATPRQWNGTWNFVNSVKRWRIPDQEGENGLPYRTDGTEADATGAIITEGDPRVVWFEDGTGFDADVVQYSQLKYPSNSTNTPVATGIEARLIEAEAALNGGAGDFAQIHNDLRATIGLGPVDAGGDPVAAHFKERAYWLWQTGHRLGDLRRLIRQYDRAPEEVFPTGTYHKGGPIGTDVNFPVPIDEQNNPNFESCLSRDA